MVWILTRDYNDYNQHGEYFVEVFASKPTREQLLKCDVPEQDIEHVLNGGGRRDAKQDYWDWFNLEQRHPK